MCVDYCDDLFRKCAHELYLDPYVDPASQFPTCRDASILCHPADSFIADGEQMCKALGYRIDPHPDNCFRGEFKVGTKYQPLPRKHFTSTTERPTQAEEVSWVRAFG